MDPLGSASQILGLYYVNVSMVAQRKTACGMTTGQNVVWTRWSVLGRGDSNNCSYMFTTLVGGMDLREQA